MVIGQIFIPANSKEDVILPVSDSQIVYESRKQLNQYGGIKILSKGVATFRLSIPSSKYIFEIRSKN
jgi:hypothetical protein